MIKPYSPVNQDFIWVAEYIDGSFLTEFDSATKKPNSFKEIRRKDLVRFGLVGHGIKLYHEVYGGYFKINGQMLEFSYKEGNEEYRLTGQLTPYNDIITYKDAEAMALLDPNKKGGDFYQRVTQFNFGYKVMLNIKGVRFNFKALVCIPYNSPSYMNFRLVSDRKLDGEFIVRKNGLMAQRYEAPLDVGVGGELNWIIQA